MGESLSLSKGILIKVVKQINFFNKYVNMVDIVETRDIMEVKINY